MDLQIKQYNYKPAFGSVNNPIRNFRIKASKGMLSVSEFNASDLKDTNEVLNLSRFFIDNFIDGSTNPAWTKLKKPQHQIKYTRNIENFIEFIHRLFKKDDGNTTILIAKDKDNNIQAGIISKTFNTLFSFEDKKTGYIDSLAVNKEYRNNHIAKTLLEKTTNANKYVYSDIILFGVNKAVPFYKKMGYNIVTPDTKEKQKILEYIKNDRTDIPKFAKILEKNINMNSSRWYNRLYRRLTNGY